MQYPIIDSTSDEAKRLLRSGKTGEFVVTADTQNGGHGRYGRDWVSPEGNIYTSLVILPDKSLHDIAQLSFVAAVAVGDMLSELLSRDNIHYKWPNDVLVNGKKIAGILLESASALGSSRPDFLIIGIGVNLVSHPQQTIFPATNLKAEGASLPEGEVRECLQMLLKHFTKWRNHWESRGFPSIREEWLSRSFAKGEVIKADTGKECYHGVFEDLTETGELVLREEGDNIRYISSGELFFG